MPHLLRRDMLKKSADWRNEKQAWLNDEIDQLKMSLRAIEEANYLDTTKDPVKGDLRIEDFNDTYDFRVSDRCLEVLVYAHPDENDAGRTELKTFWRQIGRSEIEIIKYFQRYRVEIEPESIEKALAFFRAEIDKLPSIEMLAREAALAAARALLIAAGELKAA